MEQLASALRREQELLDLLLFKLVETRLLLRASESRYVARASDEVERARHHTRQGDRLRAAALTSLGLSRTTGRTVTLHLLASTADEPWAGILRDHHRSLCAAVTEIAAVNHENAALARQGMQRLADERLTAATAPTRSGQAGELVDQDLTRLAEQAAYDSVLDTAGRLRMPALLEFLG